MAEIIDLREEDRKGMPRWLLLLIGLSGVAVLWAVTYYVLSAALNQGIPPVTKENELSDLATLLFGTSGIALAIFSLLVGGVAVAGWNTIKEGVRKDVEAAIRSDIKTLEKELVARVLAGVGMVLGLFYARTDEHGAPGQGQDAGAGAERLDYLAEVVQHCWRAYKMLKEVGSGGQYMALNNYVYFSCLHGDPSSRTVLLEKAVDLRQIGEERSYWDALLTYCLAVEKFSDKREEIEAAEKMARELSARRELTDRQKREAAARATSLLARLMDQGSISPRT